LNWINRFIVRTGSVAAPVAFAILAFVSALPARADASLNAVYQGQTIRFTQLATVSGASAIGVNDSGFQTLLRACGASLTWRPGERYVLITTSAPVVVSFAIGDRRYDVGPIALQASFAPYQRADDVYLPLNEVFRGLDLALRQDARGAVLQPQLATLDVHQDGNRVIIRAHGGAPLHPRVVRESDAEVTYAFDGVGTSLTGVRRVAGGGVREVRIATGGTTRSPTTLVTVELESGTDAEPPRLDGRDAELAFDGPSNGAQALPREAPTPEAPPAAEPTNGPASVTGVSVSQSGDGVAVAIAIDGSASYEWHRLREPDNRFWVDIKNARLQDGPIDQTEPSPLVSMRVRQADPSTVRIALSLVGPKAIALTPSQTGLGILGGGQDLANAARFGNGSVGAIVSAAQDTTALVTPAPLDAYAAADNSGDSWKFGLRSKYVPTNPHLIVIDPGHGGSDRGSVHGGIAEADVALDMSKRLRDILIARGWQVKMTRATDVDVYAPGDTAHQELQARVDVANNAGARLFVSIHANAFINSGPYGTTVYISKPDDAALARIVESHLAADGTKDDGIVKSHLYVTLHARMPAVLIETAFLSNPSDYALLASPAWRQKVAQEIADGIGQYARDYPAPNQSADNL
jgi:N-acetylmuramoyl-L-alanine amidase